MGSIVSAFSAGDDHIFLQLQIFSHFLMNMQFRIKVLFFWDSRDKKDLNLKDKRIKDLQEEVKDILGSNIFSCWFQLLIYKPLMNLVNICS